MAESQSPIVYRERVPAPYSVYARDGRVILQAPYDLVWLKLPALGVSLLMGARPVEDPAKVARAV